MALDKQFTMELAATKGISNLAIDFVNHGYMSKLDDMHQWKDLYEAQAYLYWLDYMGCGFGFVSSNDVPYFRYQYYGHGFVFDFVRNFNKNGVDYETFRDMLEHQQMFVIINENGNEITDVSQIEINQRYFFFADFHADSPHLELLLNKGVSRYFLS